MSGSKAFRQMAVGQLVAMLLLSAATPALATGPYERDVKIDPVFGLPAPPVHWDGGGVAPFDPQLTAIAAAIFGGIFVCALLWGLIESRRSRSLIPLALSLSGIPCVLAELNLDIMGGVVYANNADTVVFSLLGRHMGWFIIAAWSAYGGLFGLAAYQVFSRPQLSNKAIWLGLLLVCAGQTFFEEMLGLFNGIYYYYGNQPLTPFTQFAWWIILPTSGGVCLLSALSYRFRASLGGVRAFVIVLIAPFTFCGFMGLVSLPAWIAVNSELPWLVNQLLGLTTVVAGLLGFAAVMKLVLNRDPFDLKGTGTSY